MADIISESGMSAGAIYGHFEGKQQLALAVAQRILGNRMAEFDIRLGGGELPAPSRMLRVMMEGLRGDLHDTGVLLQLWGEAVTDTEMSGLVGPIFVRIRGLMGPYLRRWAIEHRGLGEDVADTWSEDVLFVFFGIAQGYIVQSALLPGFDSDAYFRGVAAVLDGEET
jgi:AcrR family transcriptional regulator